MEFWDYKNEEDYDYPKTDYNLYATMKNTQWRCWELALEKIYRNPQIIPLSEILRYFKSRGTNYGLLFRWKGEKGATLYIEQQMNNRREEYGLGRISVHIDYTSKKPKKRKSKNRKSKRNSISGTVRQNVFMRDNYTCQICGRTIKDGVSLHLDHIIPKSKGGSDSENNLQCLCNQCNLEKHNRTDLLHDKLKLAELAK